MYGGRAIDDFDRRILRTYMDEYMGDFIFDSFQTFHFYMDDTVDYKIPHPEEPELKDEYLGRLMQSLYNSGSLEIDNPFVGIFVKPKIFN